MVKLITTDSYFQIFPILQSLTEKTARSITERNLIFCEAKVSLMVERFLTEKTGGTFNTDVYSFGKFLRKRKNFEKLLSKEGSAMVVKRILASEQLKCFKSSKTSLAPTLYDLIIQLKSAKVTPLHLQSALPLTQRVLKNKLDDLTSVYEKYEQFIEDNRFEDQSSMLSYLPDIINEDEEVKNANVYLLGYTGLTAQARAIVEALTKRAKSVTAILTEGENKRAFVNETSEFIRTLCREKGFPIEEEKVPSEYGIEARLITENTFAPIVKCEGIKTDKVFFLSATNPYQEIERVAETIRGLVNAGKCRYRDVTVALPDVYTYGEYVKSAFRLLGIPYFCDAKRKPDNHPLITLIVSYVDLFRKNFERKAVSAFFKNPFVIADKKLSDKLENFLIENNVNYTAIKRPLKISNSEDKGLALLEQARQDFTCLFERFDVRGMLEHLNVQEKISALGKKLQKVGEVEEFAVNEQIYEKVVGILDQMDKLLGGVKLSLSEYKAVFLGGVSALELSIIPQYNDAVFVGGYKETALAKAKHLFVVGLTSLVPEVRQDVALLSDGDINALEEIKVMVEPKIKVVNHRVRENLTLALSAFTDGLYLSYPVYGVDGKKNVKSEILPIFEKLFTLKKFPDGGRYLTEKQGCKSFAYDCGEFSECKLNDFTEASSYYEAVGGEKLDEILNCANKTIKKRLDNNMSAVTSIETSPTTVEDYFKCPYLAFWAHAVKLKTREEGKVDSLSVGNLAHEILYEYAKNLHKVNSKEDSDGLVDEILSRILEKDEYVRLLSDKGQVAAIKRLEKECRKYCYNTYLYFADSEFKVSRAEASFGSSANSSYPAINLLDGKLKLKGKIDRVDESEKYFRVVDYKTGSSDPSDKALFAGIKLQLMLYAAAVEGGEDGDKKQPAGLYYLPISDKYENLKDKNKPMAVGRTLADKDALTAQDKRFTCEGKSKFLPTTMSKKGEVKNAMSQEAFKGYINYALNVSKLAAKNMYDGVIIPSPYEDTCDYCQFKSLCAHDQVVKRTLGTVNQGTIINSNEGED